MEKKKKKKLISWLENCHTGDFLTGTHADVEPPPPKCIDTHDTDENPCKCCKNLYTWWTRFKNAVDDILLHSNIHTCERGQNKDGTIHKGKPSSSCKDNKWGKCKA